jgi:plastocyanin
MRRLLVSLALALTALGGVALAQSPAPAPSTTAAPMTTTSSVPVVHVKNFAYEPATVTIDAGQSVRWVQDDDVPHTVTATDKSFDSGNLDAHKTWTHRFDKAGTYAYTCTYHPMMRGTVVVK